MTVQNYISNEAKQNLLHCKSKGVKRWNKAVSLYKNFNTKGKYLLCWQKEIQEFIFFESANLIPISKNEKIEILCDPNSSEFK